MTRKSDRSFQSSAFDRWGLRIALTLAAATAFILLRPSSCHGQELELKLPSVEGRCAPDVTDPRTAVVEHEGQSGIWFHSDVARCMLGRLKLLPLYAERITLLEQRLDLSDSRTTLLREQVELAEEGESRAVGALDESEAGRRRAEEKLHVWFRNPLFLVGAGVVVTVVLEVAAVVLLRQVN